MKNSKLKRYNAYRPSGVEWLGEIPADWKAIKGNYIFTIINERSKKGEEALLTVSEHYGVKLRSDSNVNMFMAESYEGYKMCFKGDLVINSLWAWSRGLGFSDYDGIVSTAYSVYRPNLKLVATDYLNYLLRTDKYVSQYLIASKGIWISRLQLSDWSFLRIPVLIPPLSEQTAIAKFLNTKTALIDKAIALKEKQIALLKERRQAIIHQAVTKGLNPDVPMKDSCIDWIGEIPAHWEVKRLKYIFKIVKRIAGKLGYDVLAITQKGIKIKDITSGEGQLSMDYSKYQLVYKGEFAMNHMDLLTGFVDISKYDGVTSPDYRVFDVISNGFSKEYLLLLLQNGYHQKIFYAYGQGVSLLGRWRFPAENFNCFSIPIPPLEEQKKIVAYIENNNSKIDKAVSIKQQEIEKLKEYKASLINSAVTGKIKVS